MKLFVFISFFCHWNCGITTQQRWGDAPPNGNEHCEWPLIMLLSDDNIQFLKKSLNVSHFFKIQNQNINPKIIFSKSKTNFQNLKSKRQSKIIFQKSKTNFQNSKSDHQSQNHFQKSKTNFQNSKSDYQSQNYFSKLKTNFQNLKSDHQSQNYFSKI